MINFLKKKIYRFFQKIIIKLLPNNRRLIIPEIYKSYVVKKDKNWNSSNMDENEIFLRDFVVNFLPFVLKKKFFYTPKDSSIKFFDFGCGWAPMAISLKIFNDSSNSKISYQGLDIMPDCINFLSDKFKDDPNFSFLHHDVTDNVNYILQTINNDKTQSSSDGHEGKFFHLLKDKCNLQWSSSVFTHLTSAAAQEALMSIAKVSEKSCIQINTWLIIDCFSQLSLLTSQCDRRYPYDYGDYMSRSNKNPLNGVAFKIEKIEEFYAKANLQILEIQRGSWRGGNYSNDARHYQDIIISRPILKT